MAPLDSESNAEEEEENDLKNKERSCHGDEGTANKGESRHRSLPERQGKRAAYA